MQRVLIFSDCGVPSGYGRIADELGVRLVKQGYQVMGASLPFDGLLPPRMNGNPLPYWVAALGGKNWVQELFKVLQTTQPEILIGIQDMPYLDQMMEMPYDWSKTKVIMVSPVDGVPIHPNWVRAARKADAFFTISHYGVEAYRRAGVHEVKPLIPGVDLSIFSKQSMAKREATRALLKYDTEDFVVGTMAMNQGRKAISLMLTAFFNVAKSYPGLKMKYHLDMDRVSPAGWDIPSLCAQYNWDMDLLTFRDQVNEIPLEDRYNMLDAHMVIAHREGYGLPLVEAMACGVPSIAMDYCSGREITQGHGILIPVIDYAVPGTWGGAEDHFPDMDALELALLNLAEDKPFRETVAKQCHAWAQTQTWEASFIAMFEALGRL